MLAGKPTIGRVLIVDDQPTVREFCGWVMTSHGVEVMEAGDGPEALEIYEATQPDVVLLDLMMPGMDGLQVLRALKELDPAARVVMISANRQTNMVTDALKIGARDYVVKPFQSGRLIQAVKRLLPQTAGVQPVAGSVG